MAATFNPVADVRAEDAHENDSMSPDTPLRVSSLSSSVDSDLSRLSSPPPLRYSFSDCTQAYRGDDASAVSRWDLVSFSAAIASPSDTRTEQPHIHPQSEDGCSATGSCHRCKRRPVLGTLLACISPRCRLKFCTTCLNRNHATWAETVVPSGRIHCPRCRQICTCKACSRRFKQQVIRGASASVPQSFAHLQTPGCALDSTPHSAIAQSSQVMIPRELLMLLVQTAIQPVGVQPRPLL
jgi:hypothetical protein